MNNIKYQWLDLLRGISALLVCANHLRAAMFVDYSAFESSSLLVKLFYFLTGLGSQSVIVFFVLSGFFVGGSVIKRWSVFSYSDYLLARFVRLWIVLVPALLLTLFLDQYTSRIAPDVFSGVDFSVINSGPKDNYSISLATFLQNLFFLQTVSAPVFGSNSPLWSLSNEFWYYICFPLFLFLFERKTNPLVRLTSIAIIATLGFSMQDKVPGLVVWMIGAGVYCLPRGHHVAQPLLIAVTLPLFVVTLAMSKAHLIPGSFDMIALGCSTGLLIVSLRGLSPMPTWLAKPTEWLASISYTLYLIHFPLVMLFYVTSFRGKQVGPDVEHFAIFFSLIASLLLIAHCLWVVFEKRTESVKIYLIGLLHRRLRPAHNKD